MTRLDDADPLPVDHSSRLMIVDAAGRLLLFRYHTEHRAPFWSTVGGRLEPGETHRDAAARELAEETGFAAQIGPLLHVRNDVYAAVGNQPSRWIEHYFAVRCEGGEPSRARWTDEERATILEHRWWSADDLNRADLADFLPTLIPHIYWNARTVIDRTVVVTDGPVDAMRWYVRIPPDHETSGVYHVYPRHGGIGGLGLVREETIPFGLRPRRGYLSRPLHWARDYDVRRWRVFTARAGRKRIGAAVVAFGSPELALLRGRADRAVLMDVRDNPFQFVSGATLMLFRAAAEWARAQGCRWLVSETRNTDYYGFRFHLERGCELGAIHRFADPDEPNDPDEARFVWYLDLREYRKPARPAATGTAERAPIAAPPLIAADAVAVRRVTVTDGPMGEMDDYARVPIAFEVRRVLDFELGDQGRGGLLLHERAVDAPWVKDYDNEADGEDSPQRWARRFDVARWRVFRARSRGRLMGGAVVAFATPGMRMLEGRRDLALLWDIRVAPGARGHGIGARLFRAAEAWAREQGCRWLKIETQNINVAACRFYARMGCELGAIDRFAYPDLPDEAQLLWYRDLKPRARKRHR